MEQYKISLENLQFAHDDLNRRYLELENNYQQCQEEKMALKQSISSLEQENKYLAASHEQDKSKMNREFQELEKKYQSQMSIQKKKYEGDITSLHSQINQVKHNEESLRMEMERLRNAKYQQNTNVNINDQGSKRQYEKEISKLFVQIQELNNEITTYKQRESEFKNEIFQLKSQLSQINHLLSKSQQKYTQSIEEKTREEINQNQQIAEFEKKLSEMELMIEKYKSNELALQKKLGDTLEMYKTQLNELQHENNYNQTVISSNESQILKLSESIKDKSHTIDLLNQDLNSLKLKLKPDFSVEMDELKIENKSLLSEISKLKEQNREFEYSSKEQINLMISSAVTNVRNELNDKYSRQIKTLNEKHELEIESYKNRITTLKKHIEQNEDDFKQLYGPNYNFKLNNNNFQQPTYPQPHININPNNNNNIPTNNNIPNNIRNIINGNTNLYYTQPDENETNQYTRNQPLPKQHNYTNTDYSNNNTDTQTGNFGESYNDNGQSFGSEQHNSQYNEYNDNTTTQSVGQSFENTNPSSYDENESFSNQNTTINSYFDARNDIQDNNRADNIGGHSKRRNDTLSDLPIKEFNFYKRNANFVLPFLPEDNEVSKSIRRYDIVLGRHNPY